MKLVADSLLATFITSIEQTAMTERLVHELHAISNAIVPRSWTSANGTTSASTSSTTLAYWTAELELKHTHIGSWLRTGRAPRSHNLRCYSNPKALLGALQQEAVQRHEGWSLDSVALKAAVTDIDSPEALLVQTATTSSSSGSSISSSAADVMYIHGLRIEGAAIFNGLLVEATSAATSLPLLCVTVVQAPAKPAATAVAAAAAVITSTSSKSTLHSCSVPLYTSAARSESSLVMSVQLQSKDRAASYWVLRGAAIVCSSD
jgi:Dynein heavy chain C-terminal domain